METHKKRLIYLLLWQNLLDAKIVWNCCIIHSISFNVALVTSTLFTDYKVPMPRKNIQNFLEETCKSVHKWLLSIYLDKTTKWQGTSFFIRWVSCLLWSDQSMPRTMILGLELWVFISQQNLGQSGTHKIPDRLGFSQRMKTRLKASHLHVHLSAKKFY